MPTAVRDEEVPLIIGAGVEVHIMASMNPIFLTIFIVVVWTVLLSVVAHGGTSTGPERAAMTPILTVLADLADVIRHCQALR